MKAVVWTAYGPPDVLKLKEVEKPAPKDDQVLIKIHATTVTAGDCEMRSLKMPLGLGSIIRIYAGIIRPKRITILGQELAGVVESVGKNVTRFKAGDRVFGRTGFTMGAYAEYICLPESPGDADGIITEMPSGMSFVEAAAVPLGGLESLHFLGKANIRKGEKVLINGAGGSIGTAGIQLAKYYGAEVTAVDRTEKLEMLRSIGSDYVIDYTQQDFTTSGNSYDVIFDVVGKSPFLGSIRALKENGRYLLANPKLVQMIRARSAARKSGKMIFHTTAVPTQADLGLLKELIETGYLKMVIDRHYQLAEMVEAHRYVESGQKKGNVVIPVISDAAANKD